MKLLTFIPVEHFYSPFRQKPGAARGRVAGVAHWRGRRACCHRLGWAWYRCTRRLACHQLSDGQHHRSLCTSHRYVICSSLLARVLSANLGRTGRAGKTGVAITFLTNDDDEVMYDLKQEISKSPISKVPPELARHEAAQQKVTRDMKRKRDGEDQG